jgi:hypothetical protein
MLERQDGSRRRTRRAIEVASKTCGGLRTGGPLALAIVLAGVMGTPAAAQRADVDTQAQDNSNRDSDIIITASTLDLLGKAATSSQGSVTGQELEQRPVYRVGQLLETIPGLSVTAHSGEGKANQYLLRGFNLDHGTDLATFIDGMPVNMRTHGHGQGYTDLNFLIPELGSGIDFTKGPYFANEGDFASVGADHLRLRNTMPMTVTLSAGTVNDYRAFAGGSLPVQGGDLLLAGEVGYLDGPWDHGDGFRKLNGVARWSRMSGANGFSLTAMGYDSRWNATTDQPIRAIDSGLIGRFGTLDPSDGGRAWRFSLSLNLTRDLGNDWTLGASAFAIRQRLTLWNNFTHYLDDPVNGDQHAQNDRRTMLGGSIALGRVLRIGGIEQDITIGLQTRYDVIDVNSVHTIARRPLEIQRSDHVREFSLGVYAEDKVRWTPWLRTVFGLRGDFYRANDDNALGGLSGAQRASLFEPKLNVILGPFAKTEFYVSAGRGFHSNDARAGAVDDGNGGISLVRPPLLVKSAGYEVGIRTNAIPHLTAAVSLFQIDFDSELTYDADSGTTEAGRPSRRRGLEITGQYRPARWLEFNANIAIARARYRDDDPAGRYIEDAPAFIGSLGLLVNNLGPWFGSVAIRDLGAHPLVEDNSIRSRGYREANANIGYRLSPKVRVQLDVYNLTNSHDDAADYYYTTRLPGEPAAGVTDLQIHPLEPRSARVSLTATF